LAAILTALLAAAGLVGKFLRPDLVAPTAWLVLIYGGGGAAVLLGVIGAARQSGWLRALAIVVVLVGLGVIATDLTVRPLRIAPAQPAADSNRRPRGQEPHGSEAELRGSASSRKA
jgi:hypothetical protein